MTSENKTNPNWITVPEFLKRHKGLVAKNFVYEAVRDGRIPGLRLSPKKILIRADSFDLLFQQTQGDSP